MKKNKHELIRYELIRHLAYDMAKDEAFRLELFNDEDEIRWFEEFKVVFHENFEPIYNRWINYFNEMFKQYEL